MEKEELNKFLELLEKSNSKKDAYMAIYQYGGGIDESFAKANKQGLALFAAQLLRASMECESFTDANKKNIIPLDFEEKWIDGDIFIQYIETIDKKEINETVFQKGNIFDHLIPIGCVLGLILLGVSAIVGFLKIIYWLL